MKINKNFVNKIKKILILSTAILSCLSLNPSCVKIKDNEKYNQIKYSLAEKPIVNIDDEIHYIFTETKESLHKDLEKFASESDYEEDWLYNIKTNKGYEVGIKQDARKVEGRISEISDLIEKEHLNSKDLIKYHLHPQNEKAYLEEKQDFLDLTIKENKILRERLDNYSDEKRKRIEKIIETRENNLEKYVDFRIYSNLYMPSEEDIEASNKLFKKFGISKTIIVNKYGLLEYNILSGLSEDDIKKYKNKYFNLRIDSFIENKEVGFEEILKDYIYKMNKEFEGKIAITLL
ncbi:MAG: hypothetical protein KJ767_02810 [Nanoarchaeota archaeon]|nr:hypothetical protein [Nanoarchaeota archaeon]